ncbi:hypothetical protein H0I23_10820 [Cellulophaga sp. HaHaR_3_176]|uniref:hypothetical protein n=1 Tax=Cellulophaga sp. HaHaR_3_176 TaxID=1942464 RepID=UPI001C1F41D8|nr:hypothetical protein [Cellulophaga sp. HaHaR_3_176]QWX82953.1 hypothetical protein H0I23_10820 [Cellulophaga sp. HaHaR_3_176]
MRKYIIGLLTIILCSLAISCADELVDESVSSVFRPTVTGSILYLETPEDLLNATTINTYTQTVNFDAFEVDFFSGRVLSGTITYELINTTSKELDVLIEFLDEDGNFLGNESFNLEENETEIREAIYGPGGESIEIIKNLSQIRLTFTNNSGNVSTSSNPDPKVILKSKGEFKIQLIK